MNDSIGLYLNDIGKVPLLTAEDERELSRVIETGREAAEKLESGKRSADLKAAVACVELCREIGNSAALRPIS